ncbi:MAG: RHS repeat-associated core domain-containing protein, partial [Polyangiaceae bacterium]
RWVRAYSSRTSSESGELGHGWSHEFAWLLKLKRRKVEIRDGRARLQRFKRADAPTRNKLGWLLSSTAEGYELVTPRSRQRYLFSQVLNTPDSFALSGVVDRNGNRTTIQRGPDGEITGFVDSAGRPYRVKTDTLQRITEISVASNPDASAWMRIISYAYDSQGDLVRATDAEGYSFEYRYQNHLLVEQRTPIGLTYCYRYDSKKQSARCVETWGEYIGSTDPALKEPLPPRPQGADKREVKGINSVRFTYAPEDRYCEAENGRGALTRYFGDALGRVLRKILPNGGVYEYYYGDDGTLTAVSDPSGITTNVARDAEHNPLGFTDANGEGLRIHTEPDGTVVEIDWRNGRVTRRRYDNRENPTFVGHADGTWEEYEYNSQGLLRSSVDRAGNRTLFEYDQMANLLRKTYQDGATETAEFDYLGRRLVHVSAEGHRTEWRWNRLNEVTWKRNADGTETSVVYNPLMKPLQITEGASTWRYEYGGLNWPIRILNPRGNATEYRYDVEGNLVLVRNARGQEFHQVFDLENRPIAAKTFEDIDLRGTRNLSGQLSSTESPDGITELSYDAAGQLSEVAFADGEQVALTHLQGSGVTSVDNGNVLVETWFDGVGQPVREVQGDYEMGIGWTGGRVSALTPSKGPPLAISDKTDFDTRYQVGNSLFRLNEQVGPSLVTSLGALKYQRWFGSNGKLVAHSVSTGDISGDSVRSGSHWWIRYQYAEAQRLRSSSRHDGAFEEFEHDAFGQVVKRTVDRGSTRTEEIIRYDAAGSPLLAAVGFDALMRPTRVNGETWSYDAEGRLVSRKTAEGEWKYRWSTSTTLLEVESPSHRVLLSYDGRGRLMRKRVYRNGELVSSIDYLWTNQVMFAELDQISGTTRTYVRIADEWDIYGHVDSGVDGERAYVYARDPSGAVIAAFADDGRQVFAAERTVFGQYTCTMDEIHITARLLNQFEDSDVGLTYNRFRWYAPEVGMYASRDPRELDGTLNPRDYVRDPYRWVDPTGLAMSQTSSRRRSAAHGHPARPDRPDPSSMTSDETHAYLTGPGYNATNGTEAVPGYVVADATERTGRGFRSSTTDTIDAAGDRYGCHSCGRNREEVEAEDGEFGHWRKDHQPPLSHVRAGDRERRRRGEPVGTVRIYPHCPRCSNTQGGGLASRPPTAAEARRAADMMAPRASDATRRGPPRRSR